MKTKIVTKYDYVKIKRGHQPRKSGAGPHKDSRLNRETKKRIIERNIDES
jgi:hypothetical protein